ncbi:UV-damaged DNA-binding protein rad7 [Coemansia sp. RSA 988]|nr:UV-damaged DNA-binding protein rad7 [Coemansia sp. RSA 988]
MDPNDRARGSGSSQRPRGGANSRGTTIKGPHSALTDYLQEIGVTEHFRERRRREEEERARAHAEQQANAARALETANAATTTNTTTAAENENESADAALAADIQEEEDERLQVGGSGTSGAIQSTVEVEAAEPNEETEAVAVSSKGKGKAKAKAKFKKGKGKKKKDSDDEDSDYKDEANQRGGLNQSSARKGGRMKECEMCSKTFLLRGEPGARILCIACRRSVDKAETQKQAVTKRSREAVAKQPKRRKMRKTEGGLLEFEPGLPSLQDLCVRTIAKHLDQVESFGDIGNQSMNKLCRIICKMRLLDEQTMSLFIGPEKTSLTLYDCTKISASGIQRIIDQCPNLETLDMEYCGRMDGSSLLALGRGLPKLTYLRLDGAFLITDTAWAELFREMGTRLKGLKAAYTGFGPGAMRALITHCTNLEELRLSECADFDNDCLAMLAAPITDREEMLQEPERVLRLLAERSRKGKMANANFDMHSVDTYTGKIPEWQPLSKLRKLELPHPHKPMTNTTAKRALRTIGSQLQVLDLAGFRDIGDDFLLEVLAEYGRNVTELSLSECTGISPEAFVKFFATGRDKARAVGYGYTHLDLRRCYMLTDAVLQELVQHSGATLLALNLNSVDDNLTSDGLLALAGDIYHVPEGQERPALERSITGCTCLEELDLSWVRCTTDAVLVQLIQKCKNLTRLKVYGCQNVTSFAPTRPGLTYVGRECDSL